MLVFDITTRSSFANISTWIKQIEDVRASFLAHSVEWSGGRVLHIDRHARGRSGQKTGDGGRD